MLINGDFESGEGWVFGGTKLRGSYTGVIARPPGLRSARLGNDDYSRPNVRSYSSISQRTFLPGTGYTTATLSFWYYSLSDMEPGDTQEAILLDGHTERTLKVLWRANENARQWLHKDINITGFLGREVIVYFNVFNDGGVGRAAMYVDDVSLTVCGPAPTPMPVQTQPPQTAQPTAPPVQTLAPTASFSTVTPTAVFVSPVASATPAGIIPPAGAETPTLTPTPLYQQAVPTAIPIPPTNENTSPSFWQTALKGLWYLLIFFIIILILIIAFLMIRLLWGQMSREEDEETFQSSDTQRIPPDETPEDVQDQAAPPPPPPAEDEDL